MGLTIAGGLYQLENGSWVDANGLPLELTPELIAEYERVTGKKIVLPSKRGKKVELEPKPEPEE